MPDRDDYYDRQDFNRQQDRAYDNFRNDQEYERAKRAQESERGWEAVRRGDSLGAIQNFAGTDAALSYAERMNAIGKSVSESIYSLSRIQIFEGPQVAFPPSEIFSQTEWPRSQTRFIHFYPIVSNPWQASEAEVTIAIEIGLFGEEIEGRSEATFTIYPDWRTFHSDFYFGWESPGLWTSGLYQASVLADGIKIGDRLFSVLEG